MNTFQNHASFTQPAAVRIDEWYVYQDSGMHTGPLTLEALVRSLAFSNIPRTAFGGYAGEGTGQVMQRSSTLMSSGTASYSFSV